MIIAGPRYEFAAGSTNGFGNHTVVDNVQPELLPLVDPYWYQWPPMEDFWYYAIGAFLSFLCFVSFFGNGIVVYIFTSDKSLRTPSNLLVVNLAFNDFCMMLTNGSIQMISSWYKSWMFGVFGCNFYATSGSLLGNNSIWTMIFISLDRYNVIVKGIKAKPMTIKTALLRIVIIWVHSSIWAFFPVFGWNRYIPEGNLTGCGLDYLTKDTTALSYIYAYAVFVYFTPLFTIIWAYYHIIAAVAEHEKHMKEQAAKMNVQSLRSGDTDGPSAEFKLAKVAMVTISLWFLAWTPYLIINFGAIFGLIRVSPLFTVMGAVFAKTCACYNPVVYAISHPKFRASLDKKFPCLVFGALDAVSDTKSDVGTKASTT